MASRGKEETDLLRSKVEDQLNRLLSQLEDLEELKDDLEEDEYEETRKDTLAQLEEFQQSLTKMTQGDMGLVTELASVQLAIQAAVSKAFQTPDVIKMFAKGENSALRQRFASIEQQFKLGKLAREAFVLQGVEILTALQKLGEELTESEQAFVAENKTSAMAAFEAIQGDEAGDSVLKGARAQVKAAK